MEDTAAENPMDRLAMRDATGCAVFTEVDEPLPKQVDRDFITLLPDWTVLQVTGIDAARFLQGQLTCDVGRLALHGAVPGAHCTPKGRVIANFLLARTGEETFELVIPASVAGPLKASLRKYLVFSKATIAVHDFAVLGCRGNTVGKAVAGPIVPQPNTVVISAGMRVLRLLTAQPRFLAWLPDTELPVYWQSITTQIRPANGVAWELLNIRDGLAFVTAGTVEVFIPQMIGLPETGAVSFDKGCYTGQEVIARAHYRGAVKRHLQHVVATAATTCPAPGDSIYSGGKSAGTVVTAVATGDAVEALIVVSSDGGEAGLTLDPGSHFALRRANGRTGRTNPR